MLIKKVFLMGIIFTSLALAQAQENPISSLAQLNAISVTIGGDFIVNGSFTAMATERVDQFVTRTYNEARAANIAMARDAKSLRMLTEKFTDFAKRNIKLISSNGDVKFVDLAKFRLNADFNENPYLKNGDVIIFPALDLDRNFVEIAGAVNKPGKIQFVEGDKLSDALFFGLGINKAYENVTKAQVQRLSYDGTKDEIFTIDINDDFDLMAGDRITIIANETQRRNFKVMVLGEVNRPGEIFITRNSTLLTDVIKKAGGLTSSASLKDAELLRNYTPEQVLKKQALLKQMEGVISENEFNFDEVYKNELEKLRMLRLSNLATLDTTYFFIQEALRSKESIKTVDFTQLNNTESKDYGFTVRDGDVILIPEKFDDVFVGGQVPIAAYYKYIPGKDYSYYINDAGGITELAKGESDIIIINGVSRDWFYAEDNLDYKIQPGDFIYVPKERVLTFGWYLNRISTISGIIGAVATIILLIVQFGK